MKKKSAKTRGGRARSTSRAAAAKKRKGSGKRTARAKPRKTRGKSAAAPRKARSRSRAPAKSKKPARAGKPAANARHPQPPVIRKGLPVTKSAMRRLGRMQEGERPEIKSIILYTTDQKPKNLYPRKIISPPYPSKCCTDANRVRVGKIYEELGRNYYYKVCKVCGHAVKYYFNKETEFDTPKLRKYYEWKKSVFH